MMECGEEKNKQTVALSIPMEEILSMAETKSGGRFVIVYLTQVADVLPLGTTITNSPLTHFFL